MLKLKIYWNNRSVSLIRALENVGNCLKMQECQVVFTFQRGLL